MPSASSPGLVRLAEMAGRLKEVRRQGWVDRGVADAESVADHSFRLAVLAWAVARRRGLDADKAMRIALFHDVAEAETGDETPFDALLRPAREGRAAVDLAMFDRVPPRDPGATRAKHARERAVVDSLAAELAGVVGEDLRAAWEEYDAQTSAEAKLVKQLDRVETLLQAERYAAAQPDLPIGSFRAEIEAASLPDDLAALVAAARRSG
jgi:putative hydrolase of HD superfamily